MDTDELPIDRGWAWVILIACTTTNALYCGTLKSFGIFFVEILNEFQESVSKSSLINGLLNVTYGFMSLPMLLFIMDRVGIRKLVLIGTLTMTIGYGISSQAENINFLFFSISILVGISSAFVWGPQLVAISHYFKKNYGFAVGIAVSGGCLGSLILPPIYRYLLDTYGLRGALLLAAGILSHSLVMACLLRPIEFYKKRKKISIEVTPLQNGVPKPDVIPVRTNHELVEERKEIKSNFIHQIGDALTCSQPVISKTPPSVSRLQSENGNRSRTVSEAKDFKPGMKRSIPQLPAYGTGNSSSKLSLTSLFKYISLDNVTNMSVVSIHSMPMVYDDDNDSDEILAEKKQCCKFNFSIFKKPSYILLLCVHALGTLAPALIPAFIPINAKEKGITNAQTVVIVAVLGASEFVGRICVGYCSDKPWIKKHYIIIVSQIIAGVMANCNRYFNSFGSIIIFVIVFGSNAGAIFCVVVPILTDMIGTENFKTGYAFIMLTQGPFAAVMPYVFGYLRDITGNYNMSFHMLGSTSIAAAILLLIFRPLLHQCRSETESTEEIHIPEEEESLAP